jgi:glycosyltransferase involved in cell wall biosynthesis
MEKPQSVSGGLRTKGIEKNSESDRPLVSVITVVFNGEKFLEQTILSVINQTYTNVEYIIIDGASTDGTLEIIKKYEDKIDQWISEPDTGIYDAMNKGIALAKGELIGIINSDDWYENYAISEVVDNYRNNPEFGIFNGLHKLWDDSNFMGIIGHTSSFLKFGMISHPSCFVRNEIYKKNGLYDTQFKIAADYELMLRFNSIKVPFFFIEKVLANFRNSGLSNILTKQIIFETSEIKHQYGLISSTQMHITKLGYYIRSFFSNKVN